MAAWMEENTLKLVRHNGELWKKMKWELSKT